MKMIELWGHKLAEHPNEKSIRASHRASKHLSIIHDASYFGWIMLSGEKEKLIKLMNSVTDPTMPSVGSERYLSGKRQCFTYLYEHLSYPAHLISPVNLLWESIANDHVRITEKVLMWIHPSAFCEAFAAIGEAIKNMGLEDDVLIEDLRDEFLMFELTGPRSTALLQAVLDVSDECEKVSTSNEPTGEVIEKARINNKAHEFHVFTTGNRVRINGARSTSAVGVPPRTNEVSVVSEKALRETLIRWPEGVASSDLWDSDFRKLLRSNKISDGELNKRRSNLILPGQKLTFTPRDALVPILLIQRDESDNVVSGRTKFHAEYKGGWNVIIPSGWGMDFWKSFVFAGAWTAGNTKSFAAHSKLRREELEKEYNKRPPSNRVNYKIMGIDSPFEPPFDVLLGLSTLEECGDDKSREQMGSQNEGKQDDGNVRKLDKDRQSWLLRGNKNIRLLENHSSTEDGAIANAQYEAELNSSLFAQIIMSFNNRGITLNNEEVDKLRLRMDLSVALVNVRVIFLAKGSPGYNSIIYKISSKRDYDTWIGDLRDRKRSDVIDPVTSENEMNFRKDEAVMNSALEVVR
ncbi:12712_t:CDS:2 [Acaulospora colombiana]|uniref:12712_t:CDS:1 n=1 Tax=Acaulospora colombiana TaxID=27376 RepID=A0ACA9L9B1_9GLOM|nr:12712_t:CDS:2 [Acaulospora colombiana]